MASNRSESGLRKEIEKYFKEADQEDAPEDELSPVPFGKQVTYAMAV